jgi:hypothetical protein
MLQFSEAAHHAFVLPESRPQSRRSNRGVSISSSESGRVSPVLHIRPAKINIFNHSSESSLTTHLQQVRHSTRVIEQQLQDEHETQKETIATLKAEIERLQKINKSDTEALSRMKALEEENLTLANKTKKFEALCVKYKVHMDDVVQSQKDLKIEASRIRMEEKKLRCEFNGAKEVTKQGVLDVKAQDAKFRAALKDARNFAIQGHSDLTKTITECKYLYAITTRQIATLTFYSD